MMNYSVSAKTGARAWRTFLQFLGYHCPVHIYLTVSQALIASSPISLAVLNQSWFICLLARGISVASVNLWALTLVLSSIFVT
jgi:hypothetical protein